MITKIAKIAKIQRCLFKNSRIPRESLLNKTGNVTPNGEYKSPFKDPRKRFGASLGNLSSGRVGIVNMANMNLHLAVVIAIRYSAVRRQFGNVDGQEKSVIEYQMQQVRLFPYLAACFVHHNFSREFFNDFFGFIQAGFGNADKDPDRLANMGQEIHGISSAAKPWAGWVAQAAIQECREACGGHGYLKAARFGILRDDNDANCTYEGDNNVLLQQTSNWLLSSWKSEKQTSSPFGSLNFLQDAERLLKTKFSCAAMDSPNNIVRIFQALTCHLLVATSAKVQDSLNMGLDEFEAKNESQFFFARTLALAFIQMTMLERFVIYAKQNFEGQERILMERLAAIYGLWNLEKHLGHLYQFGILAGADQVTKIHNTLLMLCKILTGDAVALADILAPPDFILNSVLGMSDGKVYQHLKESFYSVPNSFGRPDYWPEISKIFRSKL